LNRTTTTLLMACLFLFACKKEKVDPVPAPEPCILQTQNPAGRVYNDEDVTQVNYLKKCCGIIPLSVYNSWIYEDSVFNDGVFVRVQYDTLRFTKTYQSHPDDLIWWEKNNVEIGLPDMLYANDSSIFLPQYRLFSPEPVMDVKKEYGLFEGDSLRYLTSFEDNAAQGRSVKLTQTISTPAGNFSDCILFEKKAPFSRTDQVIYKAGLGVVKYRSERAGYYGPPVLKVQQVSTLIKVILQ
jgi:hypothetical protein